MTVLVTGSTGTWTVQSSRPRTSGTSCSPRSPLADLAVIVPTVNRHERLPSLLANIHSATATPHRVYFVVESGDKQTLVVLSGLSATGEHVNLIGDYGSYVRSANTGVHSSLEPYFLVANDDVVFHPEWDTRALAAMKGSVRVVGIDQGNGQTECFFLVDRRYLDEYPGPFYHTEYISWYCDTEFTDLAKKRGVWAVADGALIEHMHWTLGKSEVDKNYAMAEAAAPHDEALYHRRRVARQD